MSRNFEILQKANKIQKIFESPITSHDASQTSLLEADKESGVAEMAPAHEILPEQPLPPEIIQDGPSPSVPAHDGPKHKGQVKHSLLETLPQQGARQRNLFGLDVLTRWAGRSHPRKQFLKDRIPDPSAATLNEHVELVQRVFLAGRSAAPHLVLFCAVDSGNGCTSVCVGAGKALAAQVSGEVCIVDANLRTPALHRHFDIDNYRGLADIAAESDKVGAYTHLLPGSNLSVLTSGQVHRDPYALLGANGLGLLMADLRSRFDYVLIDSPPVSSYRDATLLAQMVDGVVLIIEANATHIESAQIAKERFDAANLKLFAAVLTKRTFPIPEALYRRLW